MKKSIFWMAAASALMLTACSSENDVLEAVNAPQAVAQEAVGFDVYVPGVTQTRAGYEGTMTTKRLQDPTAGFGVYAFYSDQSTQTDYDNGKGYADLNTDFVPNFMVNEQIRWNDVNQGWYYNPLKYWPNETINDSQDTPATMESPAAADKRLDRLTFFAYAPYVATGGADGITNLTDKTGKLGSEAANNPAVSYKANWTNPNQAVDLLWGVAPSGGLSYTAVNGNTVKVDEGMPLIDMVKPDVNTSMKFLFNHALARIGIKVVAAIDQIAPGGTLDPNTKITIEEVKLKGYFGETASLNLNNTEANKAKWYGLFNGVTLASDLAEDGLSTKEITINGTNIAEHLKYIGPYNAPVEQTVVGVTTTKQDLITPSTQFFSKAGSPKYSPGKKYYTSEAGSTEAHATYTFDAKSIYYTESADVYTQENSVTIYSPDYPGVTTATQYYTLTETGDYTADPNITGAKYYTRSGSGTTDDPYVYTNATPSWGGTHYFTVEGTKVLASDIPFEYSGTVYTAEPNYYMVIPVENIPTICTSNWVSPEKIEELRTVTVKITYYITTEDSKLGKSRTQIKNVVTKDVVFPSIANGKSYNLNLILGLTSVKMEAEVDDWKVINVQADLPQNTAE